MCGIFTTMIILPPSAQREVKGLTDVLLRHFSDILIFWKILKVKPKYGHFELSNVSI